MATDTRVCAFLAATSWLVAVVALADWLRGNSTDPAGVIAFAVAGAALTAAVVAMQRQDGR